MTTWNKNRRHEPFQFTGVFESGEKVDESTAKLTYTTGDQIKVVQFHAGRLLTDVLSSTPGSRYTVRGHVEDSKLIANRITKN